MKAQYPAPVLLAVAVALLAAACRGGDDSSSIVAPRDVIAFGAQEAGGTGRYGLYLVRPDGSDLRKLTAETGAISFPRWSPAGDRIAYIVGGDDRERPGALRMYDFRTGRPTTLSDGALPSPLGPATTWSADGRRLAFVEATAGGQVGVYDVERGGLIDIPEVSGTAVDWSPSGNELAVVLSGGSAQETDLYLVEADGRNPRQLLQRPGLEGNPRWSPNGRRLAFWGAPFEQPELRELFVLERESGRLVELGPGLAAAWSPDGRRLAYSGPATATDAGNLDIFLVAAEGGEPQPLSRAITLDRWPSWSPAGDRLAYLALADRETAFICVVRLEPEDRDCLDLPDLVPAAPAWSPR